MPPLSNATYGQPEPATARLPEDATAGAVVELYEDADGTMAADVRIPAHGDEQA